MTKRNPAPADAGSPPPKQRLTPRALLDVRRLNDPQIHPDGVRVAFTVYEANIDESRWSSHIWLTELPYSDDGDDRDGGTEPEPGPPEDAVAADEPLTTVELTRQLTYSVEGETDPLWSPDGRYLAFLSARPDPARSDEDDADEEPPVAQLWALPMDGGEARRLTRGKEPIFDFAWTPDAAGLVYLTLEARPGPLETLHRDGARRKMDAIVEHDDPRRRQFWSVAVEERKPQLMFSGDYGVEAFALSPSGDRIVYLTNYSGEENDYHVADLYIRDLETGAAAKLLQRAGGKYRLRWSPDGTQFSFLAWHDPQLSYSRESLYTVAAPSRESLARAENSPAALAARPEIEGAAVTSYDMRLSRERIEAPGLEECRAVSELDHDITSYEWIDDGEGMFALAAVGAYTPLYHLDAAASNEGGSEATAPGDGNPGAERLTQTLADRRDLAVHRETGRAVWVQESGAEPPELVMRHSDGEEQKLTRLNAHVAEVYVLPEQQVVSWESRDGVRIEGVMTYPRDYRAGDRVPLIVQVHGGPKGRATDSLLDYPMPSVWAAEGYAVLRPNYRGSEGYGHEFAISNRRDLGGGDFADVMAGVDWAISAGVADPDRVGILGGSYGGYMVNWAIGHTDRFKAAISMFGIFHLHSDYSNSRLSRWEHDYIGAYYWEEPDLYRRLSPGSYLESMRTPTLIIHGDEDDNTSISNSREIYRALHQRGIATQFVHYPREGHGIQEPNHRMDELRRCLAWMDRYVRTGGGNPAVYRAGDKVPHPDMSLELCVTGAEITAFTGRSAPSGGRPNEEPSSTDSGSPDSNDDTAYLEVTLTIVNPDSLKPVELLTLALGDIRLQVHGGAGESDSVGPIGVPLDMPGGKVLVEGESLRVTQRADPDTGELAFGLAVVFRVSAAGEGLLRVSDFTPVAVRWSEEPEGPA